MTFRDFLAALYRPPIEVTGEERRLVERCKADEWEEWTTARGMPGLKLGAASRWYYGCVLHVRLKGKLTFADVDNKAEHLATGLGLVRGQQLRFEDFRELSAQAIALGMAEGHRAGRRGSLVLIQRADRTDRADIWIGLHDRLAELAADLDARDAAVKAQNAASDSTVAKGRAVPPAEAAAGRAAAAAIYAEFAGTRDTKADTGHEAADTGQLLSGTSGHGTRADTGHRTRADTSFVSRVPLSRTRDTSVCGSVRRVLAEVPDGLTARSLSQKTGYSPSRVYDCLKDAVFAGEVVKNGRTFILKPDVE